MPDRVRNGLVKVERSLARLPTPLRQAGLGLVGMFSSLLGSITSASVSTSAVALTFDDGPDPEVTPRILDLLQERGIRATFFFLSERAEQHPEVAGRVVAEGHEVALHGANHDNLTTLGFGQAIDRVRGGKSRLRTVVGSQIRWFRPPYGAQNLRTFALTRLSGMKVVVWSDDPNDWDDIDTSEIVDRAVRQAEPGAIVLLHDGWTPTPGESESPPSRDKVDVVARILDGMEEAGFRSTTVSELLAAGAANKRVWFESG